MMSNYTVEQVEEMVAAYSENPSRETVSFFAEKFEKTDRSIIAKLAREGVYQAQVAVKKTNGVTKDTLVQTIEAQLGVELPSLTKASKVDLEAMVQYFGS